MTPNQQLAADLAYLRDAGVGTEHIHAMHHLCSKGGSYERMISYFGSEHEGMASQKNRAFAMRVRLFADLHERGAVAFVEQALNMHPL